MTIEATQAEGAELDEAMISELIATMVPRQTPTQIALLPPETQETSYFDIVFAPLSWEASTNWTVLEWMRYFYLRYAVDWALVMVIFFGTFSRDLMHVGYLILPFYFLRTRDSLSMDSLMGLRILQLYNVSVIGAILLYQAPLEGLLGDWYVSVESECSLLQGFGFYKLPTVLGWQSGQLSPDLVIFAIVHLLRSIIIQPTYKAAMIMRRQSIEAERIVDDALKWGWIRESLATCLTKVSEKENRRQRVEDIRNEITSLSREILAVESRGSRRKTTGDRKPPSDTIRRRRGDGDSDDDENDEEWIREDEGDAERQEKLASSATP